MKKIFTLAAAMLFAASMFAATETSTNTGSADVAVAGTSFTIPGAYVAGKGGVQVSPMPNKGIKVRLNAGNKGGANNTILVNVNEGYKITALKLTGVTNTDGAEATFSDITVDNVAWNGTFSATLPAKNASAAAAINITGINAKDSIVFHFSNLGGATQANICLEITYEVTATTYVVTYKANNGTDSTIVDDAALKVKENTFFSKEDAYFVSWNTKADGTGDAVAVDAAVSANTTLYAQWEDFTACVQMDVDSGTVAPAQNVEVALKEGSKGGKMYFADAKEGNYTESFVYRKGGGVQLCKGAQDSIRVVLNHPLAAGCVLRLDMSVTNDFGGMLNVVSGGKTLVMNVYEAKGKFGSAYYVVEAGDLLDGASVFDLQRNGSVVLRAVAVDMVDCQESGETAIENTAIKGKAVKFIRDGQMMIEKNGVIYNAIGTIVK